MINRVILVGRLTKDPVLRKTQNGTSVASFTLACNRRVAAGQEPQTDFIGCMAWSRTADVLCQYTRKGQLIGVEGRIQTRNYDDTQGKRVYVTEVVCDSIQFLERKNESSNNMRQEQSSMNKEFNGYPQNVKTNNYNTEPGEEFDNIDYLRGSIDISADDLPF